MLELYFLIHQRLSQLFMGNLMNLLLLCKIVKFKSWLYLFESFIWLFNFGFRVNHPIRFILSFSLG